MDKSIERIIRRTLEDARCRMRGQPDMTASDALAAVNMVRRS